MSLKIVSQSLCLTDFWWYFRYFRFGFFLLKRFLHFQCWILFFFVHFSFSGLINPKSKEIYTKANETIEKWSEIIHLCFEKLTLPLIGPPFIFVSYFLYFTTDLGRQSFFLPFLSWYSKTIFPQFDMKLIDAIGFSIQGHSLIGERRLDTFLRLHWKHHQVSTLYQFVYVFCALR